MDIMSGMGVNDDMIIMTKIILMSWMYVVSVTNAIDVMNVVGTDVKNVSG